jgi:GNAT superfamily N-acetyltransferase
MYSDFPFDPSSEPFDILATSSCADVPSHAFRHQIRPFSKADLPAVLDLIHEVYGPVNDRWFDGLPSPSETGFVAEVDGRVAGVAWISTVGTYGRLHSLTVRAPYRRMGLGTDLLFARLLWARRVGAEEVLSEISEHNVASLAVAARGGMRQVGRIFFHRPL